LFGKFSETFSTPREFKICCLAIVIQRTLESVHPGNVVWQNILNSLRTSSKKIIVWQLPEHIQTDQEKKYSKIN